MALSMTVAPLEASTSWRAPSAVMNVIFGMMIASILRGSLIHTT
ncbi:hypothetical protein V6L77_03490 [Pannonibacter sp. Pt2-lr]